MLKSKKSQDSVLSQVKEICRAYDIWPQKSKGQNFLFNLDAIEEIMAAAGVAATDSVLEVGPGLGVLTERLIMQAKRVVSVELDAKIFGFLEAKFAGNPNLELVHGDILKFNPDHYQLKANSYKLVANLPYNITSFFLKTFLTAPNRPQAMTLLLQQEVAQRICARGGKMSLLAVSVQLYGEPKIMGRVGRENFWPSPEVDSAIIKIDKIRNAAAVDNYLQGVSEPEFWRLVKIGFSAKRKQLQHNLSAGYKRPASEMKKLLNLANFDEKIRAENLSVADWVRLAKKL